MSNTTYQNQVSVSAKLFSAKSLYLLLVIIGIIAPWSFLIKFIIAKWFFYRIVNSARDLQIMLLLHLTTDLVISALVFLCFSFFELKRLGLSRNRLIIYIIATFGIGLSCALPLFLYFREGVLEGKELVIYQHHKPPWNKFLGSYTKSDKSD